MDELELAKILMNIEMFEGLDYGQIEKIVNSSQQRVLAPRDGRTHRPGAQFPDRC